MMQVLGAEAFEESGDVVATSRTAPPDPASEVARGSLEAPQAE